jgi:hypothetical protein
MAMFGRQRDVSLVRHLNRELMGNIITQQAAIYKYKLEETLVNLYGEAAGEKFYDGPFLFNVLLLRQPQLYPEDSLGIEYQRSIRFSFLRDDLVDANVVPEVGDVVLYQNDYYGVQQTITNQYFVGKNPEYPNNDSNGTPNPLNPGLEDFGTNLSIILETYYIPRDKLSISPYKERF